jgi:hypothetical protein
MLPYDPQLTQWLKVVDPSRSSIMAACEFGSQSSLWQKDRSALLANGWMEAMDLAWQPDDPANAPQRVAAWSTILGEIEQLQMLMQDDRDRYLAEIIEQADGLADYVIAFIGASQARHPWTIELINCGLAIGNVAYMHYKQKFRRVRPSILCPGLVPPFGPPAHPAFPSGHSFLGHFIALLLLEIPALRQRYGMFGPTFDGTPGTAVDPYSPATVTISLANPAVVTGSLAGLSSGDPVIFQTTGSLPSPITAGTTYYVITTTPFAPGAFGISSDPLSSSSPPTLIDTTPGSQSGIHTIVRNPLAGRGEISSPLFWLAQRLAKNRERLGVHYASDSFGSRHLAAAIWRALLHDGSIDCPTLRSVRNHAVAEWPTKWS